jgi:uncharacterized protein (DUF433 family)
MSHLLEIEIVWTDPCVTLDVMRDDLIVSDSRVLGGKPCVRGTRLSVEFLLELAASGATRDEILVRYPQLTREGVAAAFRYAADVLKGEQTWELKITA